MCHGSHRRRRSARVRGVRLCCGRRCGFRRPWGIPVGVHRIAVAAWRHDDVSADGTIVVGVGNSASGSEAFIWDSVNGMRSLQSVLTEDFGLDLTGWTLNEALGVSNNGLTIVGRGINPNGFLEAWIATVPEPCAFAFLASGGLVLTRRRRNGLRRCQPKATTAVTKVTQ